MFLRAVLAPKQFQRAAASFLAFTASALIAAGQPSAKKAKTFDLDHAVVNRGQLLATGKHVDLYRDGMDVDPSFVTKLDAAYEKLEEITGRKFDVAVLGKVRFYVSSAVGGTHVWMGYSHPLDPKGIVLIGGRVYGAAFRGTDSTHVHELAHLLTWKYKSHTLREGLATYLAQQVLPGTGSGLSAEGTDWSADVPDDLQSLLGSSGPASSWTGSADISKRRLYYHASHRFVEYLMSKGTFDQFMKVYESEDPAAQMEKTYGASRAELARQAVAMKKPTKRRGASTQE